MIKFFDTQGDQEDVLILTRKHRIVLILPIAIGVVGFFLGIAAILNFSKLFPEATQFGPQVFTILVSILFLFLTLFVFIEWFNYHLSLGIVTDENLVDIDQKSPFFRKVAKLNLKNIEDISATRKGFLQAAINYGDVHIQTAGELNNFLFDKIANPYDVAKKIMEIKNKYGYNNSSSEENMSNQQMNE